MDSEDCSTKHPVSVLQGDKFFFNRIISRESSSVGCSSRIYYRSAEGVPFKWEMQPGKSKNPPGKEVVPPIRAPPAVLSLGLPKPCIDQHKVSTGSRVSRVWFWKKSKRNQPSKKVKGGSKKNNNGDGRGLERAENSELCNSDIEFIDSSPRCSSSSSLSSSSINGHSLPSSRIHSPARDLIYGHFSCIPWNIAGIMICVAKRV